VGVENEREVQINNQRARDGQTQVLALHK
jgi:hypothetical protein